MALNAYTIYGSPLLQRKKSNEALDVQVVTDSDEPWLSQPAIPPRPVKTRFVPAQGEYDEKGIFCGARETFSGPSSKETVPKEMGSWYTSLPRRHASTQASSATSKNTSKSVAPSLIPTRSHETSPPVQPRPNNTAIQGGLRQGGDWFTSVPIKLNPESVATPTLADMLRRDPPNVSNPHTPPIHYGIGPNNKGYTMLSKSGWEEGQPLGPQSGLLGGSKSGQRKQSPKRVQLAESKRKKEKWMLLDTSMPKLVVPRGEGFSGVEIVDLTIPDEDATEESSEDEEGEDSEMFATPNGEKEEEVSPSSDSESEESDRQPAATASSQSKAILTPIPVALKHDRKGLGLSTSKKLVTHSSLALRHHIQHGALERRHRISEMKRLERERLRGEFGRGKRAFARKAKEEQRKRDRLMEYMAS